MLDGESGVCSLAQNRYGHSAKMVYLGINQKSTAFVNNLFNVVSDVHDKETRASTMNQMSLPRCHLEVCKGNLKIRGPAYHN